MGKKYYTLASRDGPDAPFAVQFGSYDRKDVDFELRDMRDKGVPKGDLRIFSSGDKQSEVDAALAELNRDRIVEVYFRDWGGQSLCHVATVQVPSSEGSPLEYAWRWTNNVEGSWSWGTPEFEDGKPNGDYNDRVLVRQPLKVDKTGRRWGHRSSMVGDRYVMDGRTYEVAVLGFAEVG